MFRSSTSSRTINKSSGPARVSDQEKKSLKFELDSIEVLLQAMDDQQERSISPFITPQHIAKDTEVLKERASKIREILGD